MTSPASTIEILDEQQLLSVDADRMREVARRVLERFESNLALEILFTDDESIHDLNVRFLDHDYPTDVITFPLDAEEVHPDDEDDAAAVAGGSIVISVETALREAAERDVSPEVEVALYLVHGILHLVGFDDTTEEASSEMDRETGRVLSDLGFDVSGLGETFREGVR